MVLGASGQERTIDVHDAAEVVVDTGNVDQTHDKLK